MDAAGMEGVDLVTAGTSPPLPLRAAAAMRWSRPDLTAGLAEAVLESATDVDTWATAAGWLLHGRAALGDARVTACDLIDGLDRWGDAGAGLMGVPGARRLWLGLAGSAWCIGETAAAHTLLSVAAEADGGDDADPELRADVLTELARRAVDDTPGTAADALTAAEQAWRAVDGVVGVASVMVLRTRHERQAGRAEAAARAAGAVGLHLDRHRAGTATSDHVAAALTTEWIATLVDAGRVGEARGEPLTSANELLARARTSRQVAALGLVIARVHAATGSPDAVLAALEPAARAAADSDVPDLESACRTMLGELHETAGRLDSALVAVRAAMTAERRDRERGTRLRDRLAVATASWAASRTSAPSSASSSGSRRAPTASGLDRGPGHHGAGDAAGAVGVAARGVADLLGPPYLDDPPAARAAGGRHGSGDDRSDDAGAGARVARTCLPSDHGPGGAVTVEGGAPEAGTARGDGGRRRVVDDGRFAEERRADDGLAATSWLASPESTIAASSGGWVAGGSLIGDALQRELAGRSAVDDVRPPSHGRDDPMGGPGHRGASGGTHGLLFGSSGSHGPVRPARDRPGDRWEPDATATGSTDFYAVPRDRPAPPADRPWPGADTVVFEPGTTGREPVGDGREGPAPPPGPRRARRPRPDDADDEGGEPGGGLGGRGELGDRARHPGLGRPSRRDRSGESAARRGAPSGDEPDEVWRRVDPGHPGSTDGPGVGSYGATGPGPGDRRPDGRASRAGGVVGDGAPGRRRPHGRHGTGDGGGPNGRPPAGSLFDDHTPRGGRAPDGYGGDDRRSGRRVEGPPAAGDTPGDGRWTAASAATSAPPASGGYPAAHPRSGTRSAPTGPDPAGPHGASPGAPYPASPRRDAADARPDGNPYPADPMAAHLDPAHRAGRPAGHTADGTVLPADEAHGPGLAGGADPPPRGGGPGAGRGSGDADGLGLADLLAGALAAYRDL